MRPSRLIAVPALPPVAVPIAGVEPGLAAVSVVLLSSPLVVSVPVAGEAGLVAAAPVVAEVSLVAAGLLSAAVDVPDGFAAGVAVLELDGSSSRSVAAVLLRSVEEVSFVTPAAEVTCSGVEPAPALLSGGPPAWATLVTPSAVTAATARSFVWRCCFMVSLVRGFGEERTSGDGPPRPWGKAWPTWASSPTWR